MTPRVSVIIPTHNRLAQLQRAVQSVRTQSWGDLEIIVVDDRSSDGTARWLATQPDLRTVPAGDTGAGGAGAARNRGMAVARGDLLAFLDDDDAWRPSYLEQQITRLQDDGRASLSHAMHLEVDPHGRSTLPDLAPALPYTSQLEWMLAECFIHTMSVVVCRRSLYQEHGGFDESLQIVQDYEWYARLLAAGVSFAALSQPLVERSVPGGLVTRHRAWAAEEAVVIRRFLRAPHHASGRTVRSARALFFGKLALARGDMTFACRKLVESFAWSPVTMCRIAGHRIVARLNRRPALSTRSASAS